MMFCSVDGATFPLSVSAQLVSDDLKSLVDISANSDASAEAVRAPAEAAHGRRSSEDTTAADVTVQIKAGKSEVGSSQLFCQ